MAENERQGHKREVQTTRHSKPDLKTKLFLKVREQIKFEIRHHGDYLKGECQTIYITLSICMLSMHSITFDVQQIKLKWTYHGNMTSSIFKCYNRLYSASYM